MHERIFSGIRVRGIWRLSLRPALARLIALVMAVNLATTQVFAGISINNWQGGSGNWSDGQNWSQGRVPATFDFAQITTGTLITLDTDPTVFGFSLTAGGAVVVSDATPRTITVSDDFQWSSGQIGTNTTVAIQNSGNINGTVNLRGGHLLVNGTLNHNSGLLSALTSTSNSVTVASGGEYRMQVDTTVLSAGGDEILLIQSGGKATKNAGTGTTTIDWPVTNNGTIDVQVGTLNFVEGGNLNGVQTVASSAILGMSTRTFTMSDGKSVSGAGTWNVASPLDIGSGTGAADIAMTFPSGGIIQGSGVFNVNSNLSLSGGDLQGTVTLNLNHTVSESGSSSLQDNTINVRSNLSHTNGQIFSTSGFNPVVNIESNALYDVRVNGTFLSGDSSDKLVNHPGGTLRRSAGGNTATLDWGFTNLGAVEVQIGTLSLNEGAHLDGTYSVASDAIFDLTAGSFVIADGISVPGAGTWAIGAPLDIGSGTIAGDSVVSFRSSGLLLGSGVFNANSNIVLAGGDLRDTVTLNLNHTVTQNGSTALQDNTVNIRSNLSHTSSLISSVSGFNPRINIESNALYDVRVNGTFLSGDSSDKLVNHPGGTLRRSVGGSTATLDWGFTNLGFVEVQIGTLSLNEGAHLDGTYSVASDAILDLTAGSFVIADGISVPGAGTWAIGAPLDIGSGTIAGDSMVSFRSSGLLLGSGVFNANSNIVLAGGDLRDTVTLNLNHTVTQNGSTALQDNTVNIRSNLSHTSSLISSLSGFNPRINIESNALYDVRVNGTFLSGDSSDKLVNHPGGTLRRSVGGSTATLDWGFTNMGSVEVQIGTLSLNEGAYLGGAYSVASDAIFDLTAGSFVIADGISVPGAGTWAIGSSLDIGSGTIGGDIAVSFRSGGLLAGSGVFNANSNIVLGGGDLQDTLTLNLNHTATQNGSTSLQGNTVNIHSNLSHTASLFSSQIGFNPVINILSNGVYDVRVDGTFLSGDSGDKLVNHPGGTLRRSVGGSTATLDWGVTNLGAMEVLVGTLSLHDGGWLAGTYSVASGATFDLSAGTFDIADGISVGGDGTWNVRSSLNIGSGTIGGDIDVGFPSGALMLGSGVFNANSNIVLAGGDLRDTLTLNLNHTVTQNGSTSLQDNTINVRSNLSHTASLVTAGSGFSPRINVKSGGFYSIAADGTVLSGGADDIFSIEPGGVLRKQSSGTSTVSWGATNAGTIESVAGTLVLSHGLAQGAGTLSLAGGDIQAGGNISLSGGLVQGNGTVTFTSGSFLNSGAAIRPGASPGVLSISGNFTQTGGSLDIEIDQPGHLTNDLLAVTGTANLGGNLNVTLLGSPSITSQDSFTILTASGGVNGAFANAANSVSLSDGSTFDVVYEPNVVRLQNFQPLALVTNVGGSHNWSSVAGWVPQILPSSSVGASIANAGRVTLDVSPNIPSLALVNAGATFNGSGTVTVSGPFSWDGGSLAGSVVVSAQSGTISGNGTMSGTLRALGLIAHTDGTISSIINNSPRIEVPTNGVYDLRFDGSPFAGDTSDRIVVASGGALRKSASSGNTAVNWFVDNAGAIEVQSGLLTLAQGASIGGSSLVASNAALHLDAGAFTLIDGGQIAGPGEIRFSSTIATPNAGTYTASNPAVFLSGALLTGNGSVVLAGGGSIGDGIVARTGQLDIQSRVQHTNGAVVSEINNSPTFFVSAGGILEYPDDSGSFSGDSSDFVHVRSGGALRKSGGDNTVFNWGIRNQGTIEAQAGRIQFGVGGTLEGEAAISSGASVHLSGGQFTLRGGGSSTGQGTLRVAASSTVGAEETFNANSPVTLSPGGNLAGGGTFNANQLFVFNGGRISGSDINLNSNGTTVVGTEFSGVVNVSGTVNHDSGTHVSLINTSPRINVRSNGVYDIRMTGSAFAGDSSDIITTHPGGALRKSGSVGDAQVNWSVVNSGAVIVDTGSLTFNVNSTLGGSSMVASNALWHLDSGAHTLVNGGQVGGLGQLRVSTAVTTPGGGAFVANNPLVLVSGGSINGVGVLAAAGGGSMGNSFEMRTGELDIRSRFHHTNGTVSSLINQSPVIRVSSGGILDYPDDSGNLAGDSSDQLIVENGGALRKTAGAATNHINWNVRSDGLVGVDSGGLFLNNSGRMNGNIALAAGAVLKLANGTFEMTTNGTSTGAGQLVVAANARVPANGSFDAQSVVELVLGGSIGGLAGTFAGNGQFNIRGGQVISPGALDLNQTASVTGGTEFSGTLNVNGTVSHTAGQHSSIINNSPVVNVRSNGVYSIDMTGSAFAGDSGDIIAVHAGGTLRKAGTTGEAIVNWRVNNNGAIVVQSGTLTLRQPGSIGGASSVAANSVLHLDVGNFDMLDEGSIGGAGELLVSTALVMPPGSFQVNNPAILGAGASMSGSGSLQLAGGGTVGGGYAISSGITDIRSRVFHTNGAVASVINNSPTFLISSNGILEYPDDSGVFNGDSGDTLQVAHGGVLRKTGGSANTINWGINNAGLINVQSGFIRFNNGGTLGGTSLVQNAGEVVLDAGTFTLADGGRSEGTGKLVISATVNVAAEGTYSANSVSSLNSGGQLGGGGGVFAANGHFEMRGGLVGIGAGSVDVNSTATVFGGVTFAGTMNVAGNVRHDSGTHSSQINTSPRLNIRSNGVYRVNGNFAVFAGDFGDRLTVEQGGALQKMAGGGTASIAWPVFNSGTIESLSGTLDFSQNMTQTGSGELVVAQNATIRHSGNLNLGGGTLRGGGALAFANAANRVINNGRVSPGASPGALDIAGGYAETASGTLEIEIGGTSEVTQHDILRATGSVQLAGSLSVSNINNFTPQSSDSFTILTSALGVTGTFNNTPGNVLTLPNGDRFDVVYAGTEVRLQNFVSASMPPSITQQPASRVAHVGDFVSFLVTASGSAPLRYQWAKDGSPIANATNSFFAIPSAVAGDSAMYSVTVSNAVGSVTSDPGRLIVLQSQADVPVVGNGGLLGGAQSESGNAITLDAAGNFYFTGGFSESLVIDNAQEKSVMSAGGQDVIVAKFDSSGACVWAKRAGGTGEDEGLSIAVDAGGHVYVVGEFTSTDAMFDSTPLVSVGANDVFVAKYSPTGNLLWVRRGGGSSGDSALDVALGANGEPYVVGTFASTVAMFGTNAVPMNGSGDAFIAAYDASGDVRWARGLGGSGREEFESIALGPNGNLYAVGRFSSTNLMSGLTPVPNAGGDDVLAARFTTAGNQDWVRGLGGAGMDHGLGVAVNESGVVTIAGYFDSPNFPFGASDTLVNSGGLDGFIGGLNTNGVPQGAVAIGGTGNDGVQGLAVDRAGDFIAAGFTGSPTASFGSFQVGTFSSADAFVAKLSSVDGPRWIRSLGGAGSDEAADIATGAGQEIMMIGESASPVLTIGPNTFTNNGAVDIFIAGLTNDSLIITGQPQGTNAILGSAVNFSVAADGPGSFTYQWRQDGMPIPGATNAAFAIPAVAASDAGAYSVVVGNGSASAASRAAVLAVLLPPTIVAQPRDANVVVGRNTNFVVSVTGAAPILFQWRKNGTNLPGETNATLSISGAATSDAGTYSVVASNIAGSVTSSAALLTVLAPPAIGAQPQSRIVAQGAAVNFNVAATGSAPLRYQWRKDGTAITGATNASFNIPSASPSDVGAYSVVISNLAGSVTSVAANLDVRVPPRITAQPQGRTVAVGDTAMFSVVATGSPPLLYNWHTNGNLVVGATNSSFSITNVSLANAGTVFVRISNFAGNVVSSNAALNVIVAPVILEQPQDRIAREGASVIFRVVATNATSYQWRFNGTGIAGATNAVFTLSRVSATSAGNYSVLVANPSTNTLSANASLTVSGAPIISEVGGWPDAPRGETFGVFHTNGLVYAASGGAGLRIYSLTNANSLVFLGSVDTAGSATAVQVRGATAYVADGEAGLAIIDVSDPFHPRLRGSLDTPDFAQDVAPGGNHVFVADMEAGVQVINVSNPAAPTLATTVDTPGRAEGVFLGPGPRLYVADMLTGLLIMDVSNPAAPTALGRFDTGGAARAVDVIGSVAYVADWTGGLSILDVANASAPTQLGTLALGGAAYDVRVSGTSAYVADFSSGLRVVDVSNPSAPALTGSLDTAGLAIGVAAAGNLAIVADWAGGLQVIDAGQAPPMLITGVTAQGSTWDLTVEGRHAFIADFDAGLVILDVDDPTMPTKIGQLDTAGSAIGVDVDDQTAYVADYDRGLLVIDVSDPRAPIQQRDFNTPGFARDVEVIGGIAFVADDHAGLQIINTMGSNAPVRLGGFDTPDQAYSVQVVNQIAYIADFQGGLQIVSVTNPAAPMFLASTRNANTGEAFDVAVSGALVFVAEGSAGLKIYDVSEPRKPELLGSFNTAGSAVGVAVAGSTVAVADWNGGVIYVDISDPRSPARLDAFDNGNFAADVEIVGDNAFIASRAHGLSILNVPGAGGFAPLITQQPMGQAALVGSSTLFTATVAGSPVLRFQWQRGGVNIAGATNRALTLSNLQVSDAGTYRLVVSNNFGSVISLPANLLVNPDLEADSVMFVPGGSQMQSGVMLLEFAPVNGTVQASDYRVQASHDLINWVTLTESPTSANGVLRVSDPAAGGQHCRFYRVVGEE